MSLSTLDANTRVYRASSSQHGGWKVHDDIYMVINATPDGEKARLFIGKSADIIASVTMQHLGVTREVLNYCDEHGSTDPYVGWDDTVVAITETLAIRRITIIDFYITSCRQSNRVRIGGLYKFSSESEDLREHPTIISNEPEPIFCGIRYASLAVGARKAMGDNPSIKDARIVESLRLFINNFSLASNPQKSFTAFMEGWGEFVLPGSVMGSIEYAGTEVFAAGALMAARFEAGAGKSSAGTTLTVTNSNTIGWTAVLAHLLGRETERIRSQFIDDPVAITSRYAWVAESMTWLEAIKMFMRLNKFSVRSEYDWVQPHFKRCEEMNYSKYAVVKMFRADVRYSMIRHCIENGIDTDLAIELAQSMVNEEAVEPS